MRILFFANVFWPLIGGIPEFSSKLLPALQERGHEFLVVTVPPGGYVTGFKEYKGIPIQYFPILSTKDCRPVERSMRLRQQLNDIKRSFAPDLIHKNNVRAEDFFHMTTKGYQSAPTLVTLHSVPRNLTAQTDTLAHHALRSSVWVTCVSNAVLHRSRQLVPEIMPRSTVIYNGVDDITLSPKPPIICPPRLLCLGRLTTVKGFDLVLKAFQRVLQQFPNSRLTIAGDGPERATLEHQVGELALSTSVNFLGWVSPGDVPSLIGDSTMVLIPSRREGLSLVAIQSAMMGRPVVAARVGGLSEVVLHGKTGLLVDKEDSSAIASAVKTLLSSPQKAALMGRAARRRARKVFSLKKCVDEYDALYRKLIDGANTRVRK